MALTADIRNDFETVCQADLANLTQSRVRFFRCRGVDAVSYTHLDVYKRQVIFTAEQYIGNLHATCFLALFVNQFKFHYALALTAGRTIRSDPFEPGTAPFTNNN